MGFHEEFDAEALTRIMANDTRRRSDRIAKNISNPKSSTRPVIGDEITDPIPRYTINLSLPPSERYQHVTKDFLPEIASLTPLFAEIVPRPFLRRLASLMLRRVYSNEQTQELHGIQRVTGVGMHLLVALNVLLDLMMGCTSGGARVQGDRMLHFRTLDWGMDPLRKVIVHLDYVRDGEKVAECITYVGYVGVLTGVTKGLSVSLNFRPVHNAESWWQQLRFYGHHALVLFGFRPSISSVLRDVLMPKSARLPTLGVLKRDLPGKSSTAAYFIFCDGKRMLTLEKDYNSAIVKSSSDFIVVTNHDRAQESAPPASTFENETHDQNQQAIIDKISINAIVAESTARKRCMTQLWEQDASKSTRTVKLKHLIKWMDTYPITDAMTHFAVIMDPSTGSFAWERYHPDARALWDRLNEREGIEWV